MTVAPTIVPSLRPHRRPEASAQAGLGARPEAGVRVLFRVAGGRRLGFGHVARAMSLARALGTPACLSVRGTQETREAARRMGATLAPAALATALRAHQPALVIIDDPDARAARQALATSRRHGARVASIHDLGIAGIASDLAIDGSLTQRGRRLPARTALVGPRFAILHPALLDLRDPRRAATTAEHAATARADRTQKRRASRPSLAVPTNADGALATRRTREGIALASAATSRGRKERVLISLGGGSRRALAMRIARAVRAARPDAEITVAGGFTASGITPDAGVRMLPSPDLFRSALASSDVAVLGGGVTLYEAAALGVPAVALAVVPAQAATVRAFAAARAAFRAGRATAGVRGTVRAVVRHVTRLLEDDVLRRATARRARGLVDGRGAARAASALRKLVTSS